MLGMMSVSPLFYIFQNNCKATNLLISSQTEAGGETNKQTTVETQMKSWHRLYLPLNIYSKPDHYRGWENLPFILKQDGKLTVGLTVPFRHNFV